MKEKSVSWGECNVIEFKFEYHIRNYGSHVRDNIRSCLCLPFERRNASENAKDHVCKLASDYKCWDNRLSHEESLELCNILEQGPSLDRVRKEIKELDDQIRHFAEDTLKDLMEIDVKDWASQIGDSLVDAFANGEDAAAAFDKTVGDLMKNVVKNMNIVKIVKAYLIV